MIEIAALLFCFGPEPVAVLQQDAQPARPERNVLREPAPLESHEAVELVRVESGDTFHVRREGEVERVHLLSVDTEEPIAGRDASAMTKPQTPFGDRSLAWLQELFRGMADADGVTRLGLHYPGGELRRDVYGRILCHVILPGGEDLNLRLVSEGLSPYYNKYGNSTVCHEAFLTAQRSARAARIGVWDPQTNSKPGPGGQVIEKRPYPELIAWWDARAAAIDAFRAASKEQPLAFVAAEDSDVLMKAVDEGPDEVEVFGEIARIQDEGGGTRVVFRGGDPERSLSVLIPSAARERHEGLRLEGRVGTFRQNFYFVRGELTRRAGRFELVSNDPGQWRLAGPEPVLED